MQRIPNSRLVVIAAAFTAIVTLYSLSELHTLTFTQGAGTDPSFVTEGSNQHQAGLWLHTLKNLEVNLPLHHADGAGHRNAWAHFYEHGSGSQGTPHRMPITKTEKLASKDTGSQVVLKQSSFKPDAEICHKMEGAEFWGDVVKWGSSNKVRSWEECCSSCANYKPEGSDGVDCNVWVWCGDKKRCGQQYQECWLKHLVHPEASKPSREGPEVQWTSGSVGAQVADAKEVLPSGDADRKFHIITTAQGTAVHWQARVHYYWYKKQKSICEKAGKCDMGGFTRVLHSGHADDLMDEVPTMVVNPLPQDKVQNSWYVVLNRPYAFVQWVEKQNIPERYVLMAEPDHIFLKPLPNFMIGERPAAFPFFYIEPSKKENVPIVEKIVGRKLTRKELESMAPIGNSPTYLSLSDMKKVMPLWMNVSIEVFKDPESNKAWGWVQEMYAFTISLFMVGVPQVDLHLNLMAQPPWDSKMELGKGKPYYILHYTYGMDFNLKGEFTPGKFGEWRFDKRTYASMPPPRHLGDPPKAMTNEMVKTLINSINEASENIPCWDAYAKTGKISKCDKS